MNKEDYFISLFKSKKIGDDGAVIGDYIYSNDAFFENVHFKKEWLSLDQIAYKAMIVNISDAIAMNAKPLYALLSIAIPSTYSKNDLKYIPRDSEVVRLYSSGVLMHFVFKDGKLIRKGEDEVYGSIYEAITTFKADIKGLI